MALGWPQFRDPWHDYIRGFRRGSLDAHYYARCINNFYGDASAWRGSSCWTFFPFDQVCTISDYLPYCLAPVCAIGIARRAGEKFLKWRRRDLWTLNWMFYGEIVASFWVIFICFLGEFTHEDTQRSAKFTTEQWSKIEPGMARREVHAMIGAPLKKSVKGFADESVLPDMWAYNYSAGYYAAIWFTNDVVAKKLFWFSD
jgi:hypothetical protein